MNDISKKVETGAHIAIIIVAVVLSAALIKRYFLPHTHDHAVGPQVKVGTRLSIPGIEWEKGERTLVLVLSTGCHYCTESAPFYQQIALERGKRADVRLVAFFSQPVGNARKYLSDLGVEVDEVNQITPDVLGVKGTPTLILVDIIGNVQKIWAGKLPSDKELEVLNELRREG